MKTVVGLYREFDQARSAVEGLVHIGIPRENISLVVKDREGDYARSLGLILGNGQVYRSEAGDSPDEASGAAEKGFEIGAALGGIAGLVIGLGVLSLTGIGPVIAAGPVLTTLSGAGIGAVTGGMIGSLTESGLDDSAANLYAGGIQYGYILLMVHVPDATADRAAEIMNRYEPVDLNRQSSIPQRRPWQGFNEHGEAFAFDHTVEPFTDPIPRTTPSAAQGARVYPEEG